MRCIICEKYFDFGKGNGINYRNKPICDGCLFSLAMIFLDKYKESVKRHLKQELRLEYYNIIT